MRGDIPLIPPLKKYTIVLRITTQKATIITPASLLFVLFCDRATTTNNNNSIQTLSPTTTTNEHKTKKINTHTKRKQENQDFKKIMTDNGFEPPSPDTF